MAELTVSSLIEPKEVEVDGSKYIISKIPAFQAREIMVKYVPTHLMNMNSDYEKVKEVILKLMNFVAVNVEGREIRLSTEALIDNHIKSWETLVKLEAQMIDYNTSFFKDGKGLTFLKRLENLATEKITEILTNLSDKLSLKK